MIRESPKMQAFGRTVFTGWDLKEKILRPVIVNLLTGFLLFVAVVALRDPLYRYFFSHSFSTAHWPVFCILEPEVTNTEEITADLFVVNIDPKDYSWQELDQLAKKQSPQNGPESSATIDLYLNDSSGGKEILDVIPDDEFNQGKGSLITNKVSRSHFQIRLEQIKERALLKLVIHTNVERKIFSRSDYLTLPVAVTYFGHQ
jgi:hypothetical protein